MKVFVSGDTSDHEIVGIVQKLGHEAILPMDYVNSRGAKGAQRQNMVDADVVLLFEPSIEHRGIWDNIEAAELKKPRFMIVLGDGMPEIAHESLREFQTIFKAYNLEDVEKIASEQLGIIRISKEVESQPHTERK